VRTPTAPVKKQETAEVTPATTTALAPSESITVPVSATPTHVDSNGADKTSTNKLPIKSESIAGPSVETETPTFVPEEDGYRCPVEDCRKLFRRDNLLGVNCFFFNDRCYSHKNLNVFLSIQMHIKHYHPALLKKLGCKTFRVEDLAAARTAFETEETKPVHVSHSHSILASILTLPPQTSPSPPPPRLRSSLERRLEKEKEKPADSPASDDIQNLPLSKRLSLSESQQKPGSNAPAKTTRRKSDKRRVDYPVEETPLYLPESEPEIPPIDFESKTC
jgi:hypothetical protein